MYFYCSSRNQLDRLQIHTKFLFRSFASLSNLPAMSASNIAPVKWAQRKDSLYVTISLADVKDHSINLTERKITFSGVSGGQSYHLDLELVIIIVMLQ